MAQIPKLDPVKIGDTPTFEIDLTDLNGTGWAGVTYDIALTDDQAPVSNSDAVASRINQSLVVNADGTATATMTLTVSEANNLVASTNYHLEIQLKQGALVSTVYTATLLTVQDYVK